MQITKCKVLIFTIFFLVISFGVIYAETQRFSKKGNEFSSTSGSYATSSHCVSGDTCTWIEGEQAIVGVYYSNPGTWGGSITWSFDLSSVNLQDVYDAELKLSWPSYYGKGLHSPSQRGSGTIKVNNNEIDSLTTDSVQCGNDYFAHSCSTYSLLYNTPVEYLSDTTNVKVSTSSETGWDMKEVKITLYQDCAETDTSCGLYPNCVNCNLNDGCSGSYYKDYYCVSNPNGCSHSSDDCSDCSCSCGGYNQDELIENNNCNDEVDNDCDGNIDVSDRGCCQDECTGGATRCNGDYKQTCGDYDNDPCSEWGDDMYCSQGCSNGECTILCSNASDCGTDTWVGDAFCSNSDVHQGYRTYTCNNPDTINAYCNYSDSTKKKSECGSDYCDAWSENYCNGSDVHHSRTCYDKGCSSGECFSNPYNEKVLLQNCEYDCMNGQCTDFESAYIQDGKIYVDGEEFLVKGADYAPWLSTTGPDPHSQQPFPEEYETVTNLVEENGNVYITDYSGDGKIQTWEVIEYDLEIMKSVGVNTIRTYASGEWHDKNLDGDVDRSIVPEQDEIVQGDIPMWAYDRIVDFCNENNMRLVLGYWVQEEDYEDESSDSGEQYEADWEDLEVAKDTMERVVERYSNSSAVIAWGIGNEVHGNWNHAWFTWAVNINDYLNALNSYVRSIDQLNRPIMYAKYIGENTNFNNLDADIIAPNAFTFSAQELIDRGEFDIPAPSGKAYLLGEFGHNISHAEGQWNLSQQHAGGFFLEYNDVWWKGGDQDELGIVEEYRKKKTKRYGTLYKIYTGKLPGDVNGDCEVGILDLSHVGLCYNCEEGKQCWNNCEKADVKQDDNINILDLAIVGMNYGKEC